MRQDLFFRYADERGYDTAPRFRLSSLQGAAVPVVRQGGRAADSTGDDGFVAWPSDDEVVEEATLPAAAGTRRALTSLARGVWLCSVVFRLGVRGAVPQGTGRSRRSTVDGAAVFHRENTPSRCQGVRRALRSARRPAARRMTSQLQRAMTTSSGASS